ncbi:MAG: toll/interleukin-1 receptor domain-containing protein [Clostridia bacterium]|nr:toll/interleukin-1 receptor domain-containing protein [Clostridia bacterium]
MRLRELYTGHKSFSYIVFSCKDSDETEKLLDKLDADGYRYWLNSKLTPNEKDIHELLERLKSAAVTVLVFTENSTTDPFLCEIVEYAIRCRTPIVIYIPAEDPSDRKYLNSILERAKNAVVYRAVEQKFDFSNSLRQILAETKGITEKDAERMYKNGLKMLRDENATNEMLSEAIKSITYAASHEYPPALNFLGVLSLERARHGQDSYSSAVSYLKTAARLGNIDAIYTLGCLIADGEGFAQDYDVANGYISLAAIQGITDAQYRFAEMLDKGLGVAKNRNEAFVWYKKALDGGDRRAYLPLAYRYLEGTTVNRDETVAAKYFTEAANDGSTEAVLMLAKLYRDGVGVSIDMSKSEGYFRKAAEENIAEAQYSYAMILHGKKNYTEAFKWLNLAAAERDDEETAPEILYELAQCYSTGNGTEIDRPKAFIYYHKAALAGHLQSRAAVAECYRRGIGVNVNKRAAEFYTPRYAFEQN